jgi:cytoskeletal protein CcmA (bactofilin family)
MALTSILTAIGIPIGINECIGDSLYTINAAFSTLDERTASITPPGPGGNVIITNNVGGDVIIGGNSVTTIISGDAIITENLILSGNAYFSQNLYVSGAVVASLLSSTGDLYVDGNGYIGGDLIVDGKITGSELSSTGDLTVDGNTWLKGDLDVLGDAHIHGKLTASELSSTGDLTVDGNTTLKGNLSVWGNSFLGDQCSDYTQIQGTLKLPCVDQNVIEFNKETTSFPAAPLADGLTISYLTDLFNSGEDGLLIEKTDVNQIVPSGGIAIRNRGKNGVLSSKNALAVRGDGKTGIGTWYPNKTLTVIGEISATQNIRFNGDLQVDGDTTLGDGNKLTTIKNRLRVLADTEINGNLKVDGNLEVLGELTYLDTEVNITSAVDITNHGSTTALTVNQTGNNPVAHFKDDGITALFIRGDGTGTDKGFVGIRTSTPLAPLHVEGESIFSNNVNFNNPTPGFRRIINIREVTREEILIPGTYDLDPIPVKSLRDFLFDDSSSLVIGGSNFTLRDEDHNRTYVCTNAADRTIICPTGLRVGLQVSFIRAGAGKITFVNGVGATVNSALNFKQLAFVNSAGTVYLGQPDTYYLFGDLLP